MKDIADELLLSPDEEMTLGDFFEFTLQIWEMLKQEYDPLGDEEESKRLRVAIALLKRTYKVSELMNFSRYERQMKNFARESRSSPSLGQKELR